VIDKVEQAAGVVDAPLSAVLFGQFCDLIFIQVHIILLFETSSPGEIGNPTADSAINQARRAGYSFLKQAKKFEKRMASGRKAGATGVPQGAGALRECGQECCVSTRGWAMPGSVSINEAASFQYMDKSPVDKLSK
jgi:hypothetical protein